MLTSLIVCGDAKPVQVLRQVLLNLGIEVDHCTACSDALLRVREHPWDAVIFDATDVEALNLIAAVRQSPMNRTTLVIALVDGREQVRDLFSNGTNFVLYKPITAERAGSSLRAARGLMRREKRGKLRIRLHTKASIAYANAENVPATLLDLSEDGLSLQSERKLPQRSKVYFQFSLPGNSSVVRLSGEVVWQDASGRVGIRFADVPQSSRKALNEWLRIQIGVEQNPGTPSTPTGFVKTTGIAVAGLLDSPSNRRIQSRHACRLGADVYRTGSNVPYRVVLSDISVGGCYVETTEPFSSGTGVEIVVRTLEMKLRVHGTVQVVHPGFGMGVKFTLTNNSQRDQVDQLVACQSSAEDLRV